MIGVYKIECNGKCYVGSSSRNIIGRWAKHRCELKKGRHQNKYLQNAFNKYGKESFVFSILEVTDKKEEVIRLEQKYIDLLKPEYNVRLIAESNKGTHVKAKPKTPEQMRFIRELNLGKTLTEETRKKISEANKGHSRNLGRKASEETRKKIREKKLGSKASEETKAKMSEARKGRQPCLGLVHTEESKQKAREALLGRKQSEETRRKRSLSITEWHKRKREEMANGKTATASS